MHMFTAPDGDRSDGVGVEAPGAPVPAPEQLTPATVAPASPVDPDVAAVSRISAVPTILKVVSEATGLRLALVARVTEDAWTACAVLDRMEFGLEVGGRLEVATTLCSEVRDRREPIVIEHASQEPDYCTHPTPRLYGFESYIAVPILRPDGSYFGNVCALDARPARLRDPKTLAMVQLFAELIGMQLAAEDEAGRDRAALSDARQTAELREQFIAVLGHDLRNPVSSVIAGSGFLLELSPDATQRTVLERIRSSGARMARLIEDVLDLARGRLGGGMALARERVAVAALVDEVVAELTGAHPEAVVRVASAGAPVASLDRGRVAQMLSNLVANAVEHGTRGEPIDVVLDGDEAVTRFAVISRGRPIERDVLAHLFQPYVRSGGDRPRSGLGLGLYIASEIARAHGGRIGAESTPDGVTTFRVELPTG
jgi:signal transduction histidine kinase